MSEDASQMEAKRASDNGQKPNGKTRLHSLDDLDGRTKAAQRAFEMRDKLVAERGGAENLSALRLAIIEDLSVVSAMIRDTTVRWLKGEKIAPAEIATLINVRRRDAEIIGIDPAPRDVTPSLHEYVREKYGPQQQEPAE